MSMDEAARHALFVRLRAVLGDEEAATLMAQLSPFDWTELVTKTYLNERLESFERTVTATLRAEFRAELNAAITAQTRTMMYTALGSALTTGTLVLAATQLG